MPDAPEESSDSTAPDSAAPDRSTGPAGDPADTEGVDSMDESVPVDADPDDEELDDPPQYDSSGSGMRGRDVEVPMRVYKTVTVFSTLIAVAAVVGGFIILDRATGRAQLPLSEVDPVLALVGIGTILFGAAMYAFGTRFRAAGMGSSKNDDDEPSDNG